MGAGNFIMAVNASMRKAIGKRKGAQVTVQLQVDSTPQKISAEFLACLEDDPAAYNFFKTLAPSHQVYFSKWIESAKTEATKTKRLTQAVIGLGKKMDYGSMIRWFRTKGNC
jgi:uncharacterized protein YdeI (YjbR/CyaY-like superfamily)